MLIVLFFMMTISHASQHALIIEATQYAPATQLHHAIPFERHTINLADYPTVERILTHSLQSNSWWNGPFEPEPSTHIRTFIQPAITVSGIEPNPIHENPLESKVVIWLVSHQLRNCIAQMQFKTTKQTELMNTGNSIDEDTFTGYQQHLEMSESSFLMFKECFQGQLDHRTIESYKELFNDSPSTPQQFTQQNPTTNVDELKNFLTQLESKVINHPIRPIAKHSFFARKEFILGVGIIGSAIIALYYKNNFKKILYQAEL